MTTSSSCRIGELGIALGGAQFVRDLERDRHDRSRVVRQGRLRHEDLVITVAEALDHFRRGLLAGEVEEVLLDVLDLERSLMEPVLFDEIFVHAKP